MSRRALIFRSDLLPPSETFIVAQAAALRRYRPVFVGLRACRSAHTPPLDPVLPSRFANRYGQLIFQRTGFAPGLLAAAKAHDCSLLHAHFAIDAAEALPLVRSLQLPLAVTLHGYDVMRSDEAHRRTRQGRLYLARRQELWSEAAVFICVSNAIRERALFCGYPVEKLRILPIGIDTNALLPARPRLAIEPTILFVGRLVPKKGCHVLIEAMARVQQVLPAARLVIAGDGPERSRLQTAAERRTNATRFLGPQTRDRVHVLMRSARCLAAPSLTAADGDSEGLPTVLCEALALGLPVASTFHSGIPELIAPGEHGLLAPENDPDTLARHLIALCTDDALGERLRQAGRQRVEHSFNLARQTARLEDLYDVVVALHQSPPSRVHSATRQQQSREVPEIRTSETTPAPASRLRHQVAWFLSGNGASMLFQALYFLLIGRLLGSQQYGALVGAIALVNVLSQFSSLGMEMVLLRTVARERAAFAETWSRALTISASGFFLLLFATIAYGHFFLQAPLRHLLPYLAVSDALLGKLTQLSSRALQGADHARWSAHLLALTNAARATAAGLLFAWSVLGHHQTTVLIWVQLYTLASFLVAGLSVALVTRLLGPPRWAPVRRRDLCEGLSFSFSNSAISVYNDIDKTLLASHGMLIAAGIYAAAYRVVDVASAPVFSLFSAASPRLFREGAQMGPAGAARAAGKLLRWAVPFGFAAAAVLALVAPVLPRLFGHSFQASTGALRFLCLLPLLRGLHYAWGTAITACASQWLRTAAQAGVAVSNLLLNLWLIPRWGWQGAAMASLLSDGALALLSLLILRSLVFRQAHSRGAERPSGSVFECPE